MWCHLGLLLVVGHAALLNPAASFVWGQNGQFSSHLSLPVSAGSLSFPASMCLDPNGNGGSFCSVLFFFLNKRCFSLHRGHRQQQSLAILLWMR
jgi:hypothetical protein